MTGMLMTEARRAIWAEVRPPPIMAREVGNEWGLEAFERRAGGKMVVDMRGVAVVFVFMLGIGSGTWVLLKMCLMLSFGGMLQNGQSGGSDGFAAAPIARTTMRAFLTPVEVWSVNSEEGAE